MALHFLKTSDLWNHVTMYQFGRGAYAPSFSPFCLKLETYLRMANIPYQTDLNSQFSHKGKIPWICHQGKPIADSQFSIDYLNDKFGVNLNSHLSPAERAIAMAFQQMVDEVFFWVSVCQRFRYVVKESRDLLDKYFGWKKEDLDKVAARVGGQDAYSQGMGRHSQEEVNRIAEKHMRALSDFIGDKPYLMGERPSEVDSSVFGALAQVKWHLPGTNCNELLTGELSNLSRYCDRMKERYWPDWKQHTTQLNHPQSQQSRSNCIVSQLQEQQCKQTI